MKQKGIILVIVGILGALFVLSYDKLLGKPINDISGPKSIAALIISGIIILAGFYFLKNKDK